MIQLLIEYDPRPPFDAGSPEPAWPAVLSRVRETMASRGAGGGAACAAAAALAAAD